MSKEEIINKLLELGFTNEAGGAGDVYSKPLKDSEANCGGLQRNAFNVCVRDDNKLWVGLAINGELFECIFDNVEEVNIEYNTMNDYLEHQNTKTCCGGGCHG